ncbi:hypothetical protein CU097_003234, partial [Rhizopus azygosporus]
EDVSNSTAVTRMELKTGELHDPHEIHETDEHHDLYEVHSPQEVQTSQPQLFLVL